MFSTTKVFRALHFFLILHDRLPIYKDILIDMQFKLNPSTGEFYTHEIGKYIVMNWQELRTSGKSFSQQNIAASKTISTGQYKILLVQILQYARVTSTEPISKGDYCVLRPVRTC